MGYITMNRFRVSEGSEDAFEAAWLTRETQLHTVPGFKGFHLLKGPKREDHTLYASHTTWENEQAFIDWTRSEAFRIGHANAGSSKAKYIGHPELESFEILQTV